MPAIHVRDGQRFNIHAEHIIDGILHPRGVFLDPARRAEFGISEIDAPYPEGYSSETHTLREIDQAPYWVTEPKPQIVIDLEHNARIKAQIRALEEGQARCVREAALTGDKTRLQALEDQIVAKRNELRPVTEG